MTFKDKLREAYKDAGEFTNICDVIFDYNPKPWPTAPADQSDDYEYGYDDEAVDMENCAVVSLEDNKLTIAAGGDWQVASVIEMTWDETTDTLSITNVITDTDFPADGKYFLKDILDI